MSTFTGLDIGRYHIIEQLVEGGMATVYKAFDNRLERQVAIKFIRRDAIGAAHAASHTKDNYLSVQYRRLAARRVKMKAIVALEHTILVIAYHLIIRKEPYREWGGDYFDKRRPEATATRLVKRLEQLGYSVSLQQPVLYTAG